MKTTCLLAACIANLVAGLPIAQAQTTQAADVPVTVTVDISKTTGKWAPVWRFFGYDECNYTYAKDGKKLLGEISKLSDQPSPEQVYIRCHHLLTSGDGTSAMKWGSTNAYTEDADGKPVYSWTILDKIFDTYKDNGLKPYVEIGFMPKDLSTRGDLYPKNIDPNRRVAFDQGGQGYPPKDYAKFGDLIEAWVKHSVERYGKENVEKWYWELWNEADIAYWKGTQQDYFKLYDYATAGARRALPTIRIGGPDSAGDPRWFGRFIDHCLHGTNAATGQTGAPLDFLSFHAKGGPSFVKPTDADPQGHVRMGISNQLQRVQAHFRVVGANPDLKDKPIVIGEWDPEGLAARSVAEAPEVGYRLSPQFAVYEADCMMRTMQLAAANNVNLEGTLTWSFEFENKPWFAGYRTLSTNGVDLPVMNAFRMLGKMSGDRVTVESSGDLGMQQVVRGVRGENSDVAGMATTDGKKVCAMVWNYHDDEVNGPKAAVEMTIAGLPANVTEAALTEYRIDETHSDAYTTWKEMGSPKDVTPEQFTQLEKAGQLATLRTGENVKVEGGKTTVKTSLPRQSMSLMVIEWK